MLNVKIMSMLGSAPEMTQEQALQAQNQQMKDFLSTYNKTTQILIQNIFVQIIMAHYISIPNIMVLIIIVQIS